MNRFLFAVLFSTTALSPATAGVMLNFDDLSLFNGSWMPQTYGDTAEVNVSYRQLASFGNSQTIVNDLALWGDGYGDLRGVVWGVGADMFSVGEIRFDSLTNATLTLNSFWAGDWDGRASNQAFRVYDGNYMPLFSSSNVDVDAVGHSVISPNVSARSLILQWDFPWAVALDNISVSVSSGSTTAVPEPSSIFFCSIAGVWFGVFRKRRTAARSNCV